MMKTGVIARTPISYLAPDMVVMPMVVMPKAGRWVGLHGLQCIVIGLRLDLLALVVPILGF
jgi:hypothetical protein